MSDAHEQVVERLAAELHFQSKRRGNEVVIPFDGPDRQEWINYARDWLRGTGIVVVPPELIADWRDARAALDRAHDANDEPEIDRGLDVLDEANAAIACAVMEQIAEGSPK